MRTLIRRDYTTFSGKMLERYFYAKAAESGRYTILVEIRGLDMENM